MAFCGYKYKYRFNMSHSIQTEDLAAGEHFHTLEITLYIQGIGETFLMYEELEKKLVEFFPIPHTLKRFLLSPEYTR